MLSYAQAESILAAIYGATGKPQAGAFRGRLKHFKRLGIPLDSNPGRGAKISYGRDELYQWVFCLELAEFGIDPSIIAKLVRALWKREILPAFKAMRRKLASEDYFFWLPSEFMSASWRPAGQFRGLGSHGLGFGLLSDAPLKNPHASKFAGQIKPVARLSIFNVSDRIRQIEPAFQAVKDD